MGRRKLAVRYDLDGYIRDIRNATNRVTKEYRDLIFADAKANAEELPFKNTPVTLYGNVKTSDQARSRDLIDSIQNSLNYEQSKMVDDIAYQFSSNARVENSVVVARVTAMGDKGNYANSHIGVYYEYGTGTQAYGPGYSTVKWQGEENPFRTGSEIVTHGRSWIDMGGNVRASGKIGGLNEDFFRKKNKPWFGTEVPATHWFESAYKKHIENYKSALAKAVFSINPLAYTIFEPVINLGKFG